MKKILAALLLLAMTSLFTAAFAGAEAVVYTADAPALEKAAGIGISSDAAAEGYIRKAFGLPDLAPVSRAPKRVETLTCEADVRIYETVYGYIRQVITGQRESTEFSIPIEEVFDQVKFTAKDLGGTEIVVNGAINDEATNKMGEINAYTSD